MFTTVRKITPKRTGKTELVPSKSRKLAPHPKVAKSSKNTDGMKGYSRTTGLKIKIEPPKNVIEQYTQKLKDQRKIQVQKLITKIENEPDPVVKKVLENQLKNPEAHALAKAIKDALAQAHSAKKPELREQAFERLAKYMEVKEAQDKVLEKVVDVARTLDASEKLFKAKDEQVKFAKEYSQSVYDKMEEFKNRVQSIPDLDDVKNILAKSRKNPTAPISSSDAATIRSFIENSMVTGSTSNLKEVGSHFKKVDKSSMSGKPAHKKLVEAVFTTPPDFKVTHKTIYDVMENPVPYYDKLLDIPPIEIPPLEQIRELDEVVSPYKSMSIIKDTMAEQFKEVKEASDKSQKVLRELAANDPAVFESSTENVFNREDDSDRPPAISLPGQGKQNPIDRMQRDSGYTYNKGKAIHEALDYLGVPSDVRKVFLTPTGLFKKSVTIKKFKAIPEEISQPILDLAAYAKEHPDRKLTIKQLKLNNIIV